jgi:hypothetical protein
VEVEAAQIDRCGELASLERHQVSLIVWPDRLALIVRRDRESTTQWPRHRGLSYGADHGD